MKKRRILLALIMLIISGVSLTTATYAWFTANQSVSVEEIDVKANASGGIQISYDAATWSNTVTLDDLKKEGYADVTNFIPNTLTPVTTIGVNGGNGNFDFYLGELDDSGQKVTLTKTTDNAKKYVSFDLYFYTADTKTIVFNDGTNVFAQDATNKTTVVDKGLKYSVRVGMLVQGNTASSEASVAKALSAGTEQYIWEPNADKHTTWATQQLGATDGVNTYKGGKAAGTELTPGVEANFTTVTKATHNLYTSNTPVNTEDKGYPTDWELELDPGITKIRFYIWLEGQDVDCEDTASLGSGVGVTLNFKIKNNS